MKYAFKKVQTPLEDSSWRVVDDDYLPADDETLVNSIPLGAIWYGSQVRSGNAVEILAATKASRIKADRTECRRRLTEYYGDALEQVSRASGLYGATAQANHAAGVSAAIDASNVARDLINAATTVAEVEAVTVAWPVLT